MTDKIGLLCTDYEAELIQEKEIKTVLIQAYCTSLCSAYQDDYMIAIYKNGETYHAHFLDLADMFVFYDHIKS